MVLYSDIDIGLKLCNDRLEQELISIGVLRMKCTEYSRPFSLDMMQSSSSCVTKLGRFVCVSLCLTRFGLVYLCNTWSTKPGSEQPSMSLHVNNIMFPFVC
jgi:hypothetical protein